MRCLAYLAALVATLGLARADVLVVDAGGGGDFTDLPPAVAAAQPGDVLLVHSGTYSGFGLSRSLSIVADNGAAVAVDGTVTISGLSGFDRAILAGLDISGPDNFPGNPSPLPAALEVSASGAHLRVQACKLSGGAGGVLDCKVSSNPSWYNGAPGMRVQGSGKGVVVGTALVGGDGTTVPFDQSCVFSDGGHGADALRTATSQVALYGCTMIGGQGGEGAAFGGDGGDGARASAGTALLATSSQFRGGDGSTAWDVIAIDDGDGGDGLRIEGGSVGWLIDNGYEGGGIRGGNSIAGNAMPGQPLVVEGTAASFRQVPPAMTAPASCAKARTSRSA